MNILHISRSMELGGAQKVVYQLCRDNREDNQIIISNGGGYVKELEEIGIKHYTIPDMNKKNLKDMIKCLLIILFVVKKENIEIIHTHHRMAAFYANLVSIIANVKLVYTAHNIFFDKIVLLRFSLRNSTIVAVGDGVKKNLIEVYKIPKHRIHVIYNSIDDRKSGIKNAEISELKTSGKILIGIIGRLSKEKGIDIFLHAIASAVKNDNRIIGIIIGDGILKQELQDLNKLLKITDHILFLGYQKYVLDIIAQLDFLVSASRYEGLPLTLIEGFSQGKAIIATDINGNSEMIINGHNGLLYEVDNVDELSKRILELIVDTDLRKRLEANSLNTYSSRFLYKDFIEKYHNLYRKV